MTQIPALGPPMPFNPSDKQLEYMPKFKNNNIPRYLFRVHTPATAGKTTTSHVRPPASERITKARQDIFKESPKVAGDLLWNHLEWTYVHEQTCNFISWTSSLLFVLQYALFRHRGADNKSELSDIKLLVLDTRGVPPGTFVKDMEIMRAIASALDPEEKLHSVLSLREDPNSGGRGYYFGEYLSQGDLVLNGRCAETTMDMLIHLGLFELHPDLGDKTQWHKWADRVGDLRGPFMNQNFPQIIPRTDKRTIRKAIVMASACFGNRFALPVALMLLTLLPRQAKDSRIVVGVMRIFTPTEIKDSLRNCNVDDDRLPELRQFMPLAYAILEKVDPLVEGMRVLTL